VLPPGAAPLPPLPEGGVAIPDQPRPPGAEEMF